MRNIFFRFQNQTKRSSIRSIKVKDDPDAAIISLQINTVMEICGSSVFDFFSVKDIVLTAAISKEWQEHSNAEIKRQSEKWVKETSRAWAWRDLDKYGPNQYAPILEISADELMDDGIAMEYLDDYWRENFECPSDLLNAVARWNGGWPRFLHSRKHGAKCQPKFERGKQIEFTTLGSTSCPCALLYDIRCDGQHRWSGFQPVREETIGRCRGGVCLHPISTKTLGDKGDSSFFHRFGHRSRPPKLLLSIDSNDRRNWEYSVSIVSPLCSETLMSKIHIMQPQILLDFEGDVWDKNAGREEIREEALTSRRERFENTVKDGWYAAYDLASVPEPDEKLSRCQFPVGFDSLRGMSENGSIRFIEQVGANCVYWLDQRNPKRVRIHVNIDCCVQEELWSDMLLNPLKESTSFLTSEEKRL